MNIALWIVQVLLGLAFIGAGFSHSFTAEQMAAQPGGAWILAIPDGLRYFISACEILGGLGLILPGLTKIQPRLTPLAALGLAVTMLLAIVFHAMRAEYMNIILNLILGGLAAFVAYGRFVRVPLKGR